MAGDSLGNGSEVGTFVLVLLVKVTFVLVLLEEGMCFLDWAGKGSIFCVFDVPVFTG